jgi:cytoskeletal protein CcmA (bactofilin family)
VIEANLTVHALIVEGRVVGQIVARDRVELAPGARVEGGIETPCLLVAEGAEVSARIRMPASGSSSAAHVPRTARSA